MKFRIWLNENAWVDAAKDFLKLPSAMRDQEVMQHIGNMPEIQQRQMVSSIPYYNQMKSNREQGVALTLFKNYRQVDETIKQIEDEVQDQLGQIDVIKKFSKEVGYGPDSMNVRLGENSEEGGQTKDWLPSKPEFAKTVVRNFSVPVVSAQAPTQTLYMLEKKLGDAMTETRKNHFEIRRMWDTLGWTGKKRSDTYAKTGMRGLGETTDLGGDFAMYFPNGYEELEHRINQAMYQVATMNRHIDGTLRTLGMQRQYTD